MIIQFPKIAAIYYGLLQAGYDFYIPERSAEHIRHIMKYRNRKHQDAFFLALDMDYGTLDIRDEITLFHDFKCCVYSTHKHTPEPPAFVCSFR